ncbi:FUSC family protein [Falsochrobactrum shanghaiense]|uniref:FUSC family protein n=1 Tax=Falsochrobactrum shanghaiense TaxID=2201899 RepID=A0A316J7E5_9HYPH|nr:FUSC family protein [Falsochrobactrum shanghaiense]PWL17256.1 FUSC family protein [Falsochrobactrum shanghaiense]
MSANEPKLPQQPHQEHALRRRDALRHLLHPYQLKGSMELTAQPSMRNAVLAGLQAAITVAIALPLFYLSPWSHLIGFASLGALVALFGRFSPSRARHRILFYCGAWQVFAVFAMSVAAWLGAPMVVQLALLALSCGVFLFVSTTGKFGAPGPLIFVFAAAASMSTDLSLEQLIERTAATAAVSVLAWAICAASEAFRHVPSPQRPFPPPPDQPLDRRLVVAARSVIGAAIAVFASYACGANHPAWAAMGALAVMQGTHLHVSMNRAVQRMAGTVVGSLLAWILLTYSPSVWTIILILAVLQLVTEMVIGVNYALGQVFVTPMALLMTYLAAAPAVGPEMVPERVFDTLLGAGIGIVMSVILSSIDDRRYLAQHRRAGLNLGDKP